MYLVETRRTVGSYKTIAVTFTEQNALDIFEETRKNNNCQHCECQGKLIAFAKSGDSHNKFTIRVREVEEGEKL